MRTSSNYLFYGGDLRATLDNQRQRICDEISKLSANQLTNDTQPQIITHYCEEYTVEPLQLHDEELALIEPREKEYTVEGHWGPVKRKTLEYRFQIPFSGDPMLFRLKPSTFNYNPPSAQVQGQVLTFSFDRDDNNAGAIKTQSEEIINSIKQYIGWQRSMINQWDEGLATLVEQHVKLRHDKLVSDKELIEALPFRIIRSGESPRAISVPIQRKAVTPLPTVKQGKAQSADPTLDAKIYEEIIETLESMSLVMERSPSHFIGIKEEPLRTHFLVALNVNFKGLSSGETFNGSGKTDILIKHEDRNLFIAECKFWKGPKSLTEAIDQLLGYTTWRDTKTALMIFNRDQDFSSVLEKITPGFEAHPQFVRTEIYAKETGFRFIMRSPLDPQKHLTVTALAFDIPTK